MNKLAITILFLLNVLWLFGQDSSSLSGKVMDAKTEKPLLNAIISIQNSSFTEIADSDGFFKFTGLPAGSHLLQIRTVGYKEQLLVIELSEGESIDLGTILLEFDMSSEQQASLITITENDLSDDNSGSESTAGLLQASRDVFQKSAAFNWGQARFRIRGLDNEYGSTMINGITMNKIYDGRPQWSNWGGINDATRNQEFTMGSAASDNTFGGILGTQIINTRASLYRPGTRITFSGTNTNYSWRTMATHASGMNSKGWAYVISAGRRWALEGIYEGTTYSANSFFASVEKEFNESQSLNLTVIYAQNSRGKNSPNTAEATAIAGKEYNSYWGFQDGEKRNSRVKDVEEPIVMLTHYWKINDVTNLNSSIAFQTGRIANSRLDYTGVDSPDPSYYKYMPSYYTSRYSGLNVFEGNSPENQYQASIARFLSNRQINWDAIYFNNSNPNKLEPGMSNVVLYEDRTDDDMLTASSILNTKLSDNIVLNAGVSFKLVDSHNYQSLTDLLGGRYFVDEDTFGQSYNQQQSDLNNPERIVGEGDIYGYNYNLNASVIDAFTQFKFNYDKIDFYLAQSFSRSEYQREGFYKNGYYPNNSFGKSRSIVFENFGFKGGISYKITGQHILNSNALYMSKAPSLKNTFTNARVNNNIINNLDDELVSSADASYILKMPKFKARVTAYFSKIQNASETSFFFSDGIGGEDNPNTALNETNSFVAETITGLKKQNMGAELGIEYQLTSTLAVIATAAYGEYTYDNNPTVSINTDALATSDNIYPIKNYGEATLKGYRQPGMPQQAASLGIEYRDPKFWWIGANVNYLGANYINVAPIARTANFFKNPEDPFGLPFAEITQTRARELLKQEKFDDFTLFNLVGGKSWRIYGKTIGFFASVNNIFDVTYKTGGFEQARNGNYRQLNQDVSSGTPAFGSKYFYGYGRTYFANLYVNF